MIVYSWKSKKVNSLNQLPLSALINQESFSSSNTFEEELSEGFESYSLLSNNKGETDLNSHMNNSFFSDTDEPILINEILIQLKEKSLESTDSSTETLPCLSENLSNNSDELINISRLLEEFNQVIKRPLGIKNLLNMYHENQAIFISIFHSHLLENLIQIANDELGKIFLQTIFRDIMILFGGTLDLDFYIHKLLSNLFLHIITEDYAINYIISLVVHQQTSHKNNIIRTILLLIQAHFMTILSNDRGLKLIGKFLEVSNDYSIVLFLTNMLVQSSLNTNGLEVISNLYKSSSLSSIIKLNIINGLINETKQLSLDSNGHKIILFLLKLKIPQFTQSIIANLSINFQLYLSNINSCKILEQYFIINNRNQDAQFLLCQLFNHNNIL